MALARVATDAVAVDLSAGDGALPGKRQFTVRQLVACKNELLEAEQANQSKQQMQEAGIINPCIGFERNSGARLRAMLLRRCARHKGAALVAPEEQ